MRIVIDMQGAQSASRFRGIGRYTMGLAQAVVKNRGEHEIILALSGLFPATIEPIRAAFDGLLTQENIRVWYAPGPVAERQSGNETRREVAELIREAFLASLRPDIIHICSLFEGYVDDAVISIGRFDTTTPVSVILHDLIPLLNPDHYLKPNPSYKCHYLRKFEYLKKASLYLAVSESSRQEGKQNLSAPDHYFINILGGVEDRFQPQTISDETERHLRSKFGITRPFVLYVGGVDERKNLPRLLQAYAALPRDLRNTHQLLLVGQMFEHHIIKGIAKSTGLKQDDLVYTGYITDDELVWLYNLCKVYVFPSWHEGLGLPALEAMRCGTPVIGANTSSLPEVIGLDEALFDPFDVDAISAKLKQALENESFRNRLREHGLRQAKEFSWDKTAKRVISAWEGLHLKTIQRSFDYDQYGLPRLLQKIANVRLQNQELLSLVSCLAVNFPPLPRQRQLLVDVSELIQRDAKTGIQRVVRAILKKWLENSPEGFRVEPVYATTTSSGYFYARRFTSCFLGIPDNWTQDEPVDAWPGDIFFGLDFQTHVVLAQGPVLQRWHNQGVKIWFVVYDLLSVLMPEVFPAVVENVHSSWLRTISYFDGIVCVSRAVVDELHGWLTLHGPHRERPLIINWFHLGADLNDSLPTQGLPSDAPDVLNALNARPSFLMVGTVEPRKGHAQTLDAFEQLWQSGVNINLIIVGKQGWMVEKLVNRLRSHSELNKRLFWLAGISDEYLEKVYGASTCLIAASYGEGFGLPLIEAAQHRLPIIARDIPVFREVAGEHAFYFTNDKSPEVIAEAIKDWLELYKQNKYPKSDAMPYLTWKESAQNLLNIILNDKWTYKLKPDASIRPGIVYDHKSHGLLWQKGWSGPEKEFRWSDGDNAVIEFKASAENATRCRGIRLRLNTLGAQNISISFNERRVFDGMLNGLNQELLLQPVYFHDGINYLVFSLPDARQPGNGDPRRLAVAIKELEIM